MDFKIDPRIHISPATQQTDNRKARDLESLKESTQEFEALYVMEMYKAMRKAVPEGGLLEKSNAEAIYQDMLDMEMAKEASRGKGLGIAQAMYDQLAPLIENKK